MIMAIDKLVEQMAQAGDKRESSGFGRHYKLLIVSAVAVGISVLLIIVACFRWSPWPKRRLSLAQTTQPYLLWQSTEWNTSDKISVNRNICVWFVLGLAHQYSMLKTPGNDTKLMKGCRWKQFCFSCKQEQHSQFGTSSWSEVFASSKTISLYCSARTLKKRGIIRTFTIVAAELQCGSDVRIFIWWLKIL